MKNPAKRNVQAGYYDATGFHPLRRSKDYDADRAGDDYSSATDNAGLKPRKKAKRNPSSGSTGLILLLGAAGLAYWWFTSQGSAALPAGVPAGSVFNATGGGTAAAPKQYDCYSTSAGVVVAVYLNGAWQATTPGSTMTVAQLQATLAAAATPPATSVAGNSGTVPVTPVTSQPASTTVSTPASTSGTLTLAQIAQNLKNAVAQYQPADPAISNAGGTYAATPYVWNYYLSLPAVSGGSSALAGLIAAMPLASVFPGVSLTAPIPLSTYWAGVMSYLGTQGMSGLRGLGFQPRSPLYHARGAGWAV